MYGMKKKKLHFSGHHNSLATARYCMRLRNNLTLGCRALNEGGAHTRSISDIIFENMRVGRANSSNMTLSTKKMLMRMQRLGYVC